MSPDNQALQSFSLRKQRIDISIRHIPPKRIDQEEAMKMSRGFADQSIGKTYRRLRYMAGAALIGMPLLTAFSGFVLGYKLEPSLSDYYFAVKDGGLPRTLFLIFLAFLGGVLYSYRGLDDRDNLIHNAAGIFAFGVALFPLHCDVNQPPHCVPGFLPILHKPSAGLLYLSAVASVLYSGGPKLKDALNRLSEPETWFRRLRRIKALSLIMMTVGIITFLFHNKLDEIIPGISWIFWIEYLGFTGFGIYWVRLMWFINDANNEGRQKFLSRPEKAEREDAGAPSALREPVKPAPQIEQWSDIP